MNDNYKFTDRVSPTILPSPYDGQPMKPRIVEKTIDGHVITEAHWYCSTTGRFVRKGTVKIVPVEKTPPPAE